MTDKRFPWIKVGMDFFQKDDDIKFILTQKNGAEYVLLWQQLIIKSVENEPVGFLRFKKNIPYTPEILSTTLNINIDTIKGGLTLFKKLEMLKINPETGDIILYEKILKMVGTTQTSTERVKKHRQMKQLIENSSNKGIETLLKRYMDVSGNVSVTFQTVPETKQRLRVTEVKSIRDTEVINKEILRDKNSENFPEKKKIVDNSVNIWKTILSEMQKQINPASYQSWLRDTKFLSSNNNLINIEVKDEVTNNHITNNYLEMLKKIAKSITGKDYEFEFVYFV